MAASLPIRIPHRVFSFPSMLCCLLCVLAVFTVRSRFDDPDMWWHLKNGEIIFASHTIPLADVFSYTSNHQALVPQEWLSQLAIYGAYRCGGFSGLMLLLCLLASALVVSGYLLCRLYSGNAKVAFAGAMSIWFFGTIGFAIRPQSFGYLLLVAELALIHLGRTRNPRWFLSLPVLFAVWINCHASFMLGIVVACVFLFSSFLRVETGPVVSRPWSPRSRGMFALALVLSVAALFVNPVGIKQILYPFDTMLNMPINLSQVEEWAPLQMTDARGVGLLAVLLICFLPAAARRTELYWDELILLAMGAWLAFGHIRMLSIFGILAAPILARQLSTSWENYDAGEDRIWPNAVVMGMSLIAVCLAFPSASNLAGQVDDNSPVKAVEFLRANHLSGPMLNDYGYGGYLIWAAPEYPVMMDGRADMYEWSGFLAEYGNWALMNADPNQLPDKYKVKFCLLRRHSSMVLLLPLLHEWKVAYTDNNSAILVRVPSAVQAN